MLDSTIHFEDILSNCIAAIQEQGATVQDCLTRYPGQRESLEPLLRLAVRLWTARAVAAPPEFRRTAVARMHDLIASRPRRAAPAVAPPDPWRSLQNRLRLVFRPQARLPFAVTTGVCIALVLLIGSGMVYASAATLPGDNLYALKIAVENVELTLSPSDRSDADLHLAFAARRLDEAAALLREKRTQDIGQALADYSTQIESVMAVVNQAGRFSPDERTGLAGRLAVELARHEAQLSLLLRQAPESARPMLATTLQVAKTQHDWVLQVMGGGPGNGTPEPTSAPTLAPAATLSPETPTPIPSPRPRFPTEPPDAKPPRWPTPEPTAQTTSSPRPAGRPTPPPWPTGWPTAWPTDWPRPPEWPPGWPQPDGWPGGPEPDDPPWPQFP